MANCVPPDMMQWELSMSSVVLPTNTYNLNHTYIEGQLQIPADPNTLKMSKSWKDQERHRCSTLKESWDLSQLNTTCDSGLEHGLFIWERGGLSYAIKPLLKQLVKYEWDLWPRLFYQCQTNFLCWWDCCCYRVKCSCV